MTAPSASQGSDRVGAGEPAGDDGRAARPPVRIHEGRVLAVLVGTMLLSNTNTNMLAPLLVDLAAEFDTSVGTVGQLVAATSIPWALLAPFMGVLSDRYGRRRVLAVGVAAMGLTTILSAATWSFASLFATRVLCGVGGATTGPNLMSGPADYFPPRRRGYAAGMVFTGVSLGTILGVPAVALMAAFAGWRWALVGLGLVVVLMGVANWLTIPNIAPRTSRQGIFAGFAGALAERGIPPLLVADILERASFTAVATYLAAFLMQSYSLGLVQVAPVLSTIAVGALAGSLLGGKLADRGRQTLVYAGSQVVAGVLALTLFATTPGVVGTALMAAAFGIASATSRPAWLWLISRRVPEATRGATMGVVTTANQLGIMSGAAIGGILVGLGSYTSVGLLAGTGALGAAALVGTLRAKS